MTMPNKTDYVECEWFIACHKPSIATVNHPTIGNVEICQHHLDWLQDDYSPTKMVPPIAARGLNRMKERL